MKKNNYYIFFHIKTKLYNLFTLIFCLAFLVNIIYSNNLNSNNFFVNNTNFLHINVKEDFPIFINFPNPFHNYTYIYVKFPTVSNCVISIYDIFGNIVKKFYLNDKDEYLLLWNATNESSQRISTGGYICVLSFQNGKIIRKIGYIK